MTERGSGLRALVLRVSSALRWLPPTVARLTLGWVFLQSGWGKLHNLEKVTGFFGSMGIPAPQVLAPMTAFFEFACGILLLVGLATRVASLPIIAIMTVALATAKKGEIHELSDLFGQSEYLYICLALWLGAYGAGPISADAVVARKMDARETPLPARSRA
ncbi:MAG TPA: DoxX family protein [Thermoanaerobaculia bacterium]|nr:DoxX family protein [Thermoanaerobaculia bacterium]